MLFAFQWPGCGILAVDGGLWWLAAVASVIAGFAAILRAMHCASKSHFKEVTVWVAVVILILYLMGVNLPELIITHYVWALIVLAAYASPSFVYVRFFEWRWWKLPSLYDERGKEEEAEAARVHKHELDKAYRKWLEKQRKAFIGSHKADYPALDPKSPEYKPAYADRMWERYQSLHAVELKSAWEQFAATLDFSAAIEAELVKKGYRKPISAAKHIGWITGRLFFWPLVLAYRLVFEFVLRILSRVWDAVRWATRRRLHVFQMDLDEEFRRRTALKALPGPESVQ